MLLGLAALGGCKPKVVASQLSTSAYIIGPASEILPVDQATQSQIDPNILGGAVLIATSLNNGTVKFCSGSLMPPDPTAADGNDQVLANHHCFAQEDANGSALPALLPEACVNTKVYFGFIAGQTQDSTEIDCQPNSLRTNYDGDLGVFTLAKNPLAKYKPLTLWDQDDAPAGRTAIIVHYPDEAGALTSPPDSAARLPTASVTLNNCSTLGPFPQGEWPLDRTLPYGLRHTCDLIHGSSGSGLIDLATGTLLGVNWGGIKLNEPSGLNTYNVATKASFVRAFLNHAEAPLVQAAQTAEAASPSPSPAATKHRLEVEEANAAIDDAKRGKCGVIGAGQGSDRPWPPLVLALGAAPLALSWYSGRRRRFS